MSYRTVNFEQNHHWLLVELFFSRSLIANFICNDTTFQKIFISDFSIWILVFSILNLHFSVNYKAFQSALAFLTF